MKKEEVYRQVNSYIVMNELLAHSIVMMIKSEVVNKIYEDFESRICVNCKYSEYHEAQDILECYKLHGEMNQRCYKCETDNTIFEVTNDFGCNKFERKDK